MTILRRIDYVLFFDLHRIFEQQSIYDHVNSKFETLPFSILSGIPQHLKRLMLFLCSEGF